MKTRRMVGLTLGLAIAMCLGMVIHVSQSRAAVALAVLLLVADALLGGVVVWRMDPEGEAPLRTLRTARTPDGIDARYVNLALVANSFRVAGLVYRIFGFGLCAAGLLTPLVAAGLKESDELHSAPTWWPLAVAVAGPLLGISVFVKGVMLSAQGEALIALADIAVATSSVAPREAQHTWSGGRSMGTFVLQGVLFVAMLVAGIINAIGATEVLQGEAPGRAVGPNPAGSVAEAVPPPAKASSAEVPPGVSREPLASGVARALAVRLQHLAEISRNDPNTARGVRMGVELGSLSGVLRGLQDVPGANYAMVWDGFQPYIDQSDKEMMARAVPSVKGLTDWIVRWETYYASLTPPVPGGSAAPLAEGTSHANDTAGAIRAEKHRQEEEAHRRVLDAVLPGLADRPPVPDGIDVLERGRRFREVHDVPESPDR